MLDDEARTALAEAVAAKEEMRRQCDAELASMREAVNAMRAEMGQMQKDMAALGTKAEAAAIRKAQELARIDADIAALAARKAALSR